MSTFDRDAVIEQAAQVLNPWTTFVASDGYLASTTKKPSELAAAVLPVIVDAVLAPIEALHGQARAVVSFGPRVDMCCTACLHSVPCPTARAIASIKAEVNR